MAPQEYRLSQDVLIFLIDNQDNFLIGMSGTAADPETVKEVQSGAHTPSKAPGTPTTPGRSKTIVGRSSSNASAGGESVRKFGSIRRNVSVSSKRSKQSENGPTVVAGSTTPTGSGVHRSNTVPSRRGGSNAASPRFSREKHSDPATPSGSSPGNTSAVGVDTSKPRQESLQSTPVATTAPQFPQSANATSTGSSGPTTPLAAHATEPTSSLAREYQTPQKDYGPLLSPPSAAGHEQVYQRSPSHTSTSSGKGLLDIFKQSPPSDRPKKLQKKRLAGSSLSSAHSSDHSLPEQRSPSSTVAHTDSGFDSLVQQRGDQSQYVTAQGTPNMDAVPRESTGATLRPTISPTHSYHSNTDTSDADLVGDDVGKYEAAQPDKEKKRHRWRFSRSQNKFEGTSPQPSQNPLGIMTAKEQATSRSTVGSSTGAQPRRSFQEPTPLTPAATEPAGGQAVFGSPPLQSSGTDPVFSDSERERNRGPMSWIRGKIQDRKDKDAERRTRTPERNSNTRENRQDLAIPGDAMPVRGKSFEQQRSASGASASQLPSAGAVVAAQLASGATSTTSPTSSTAITSPSPESAGPQSAPPLSTTTATSTATNGDASAPAPAPAPASAEPKLESTGAEKEV
jgi:GTPase-activating protein SAC7